MFAVIYWGRNLCTLTCQNWCGRQWYILWRSLKLYNTGCCLFKYFFNISNEFINFRILNGIYFVTLCNAYDVQVTWTFFENITLKFSLPWLYMARRHLKTILHHYDIFRLTKVKKENFQTMYIRIILWFTSFNFSKLNKTVLPVLSVINVPITTEAMKRLLTSFVLSIETQTFLSITFFLFLLLFLYNISF